MPEFLTRVYGIPTPAGSKTPVPTAAGIRLLDGKSEAARQARAVWRQDVIACAIEDMKLQGWDKPAGSVPLGCSINFYLPKPSSAPKSRRYPIVAPDAGKLQRATEDALTIAGVWCDDSRVVQSETWKFYATSSNPPGAWIHVWTIE